MLLTVSGTSQNRQGNATRAKWVKTAEKLFGHLPQDQVDKIARKNAIRLFDLSL